MRVPSLHRSLQAPWRRRVILIAAALVILAAMFGLIGSLKNGGAGLSVDGEAVPGVVEGDGSRSSVDDAQKDIGDASAGEDSAGDLGEGFVGGALPPTAQGQYLIRTGQLTMIVGRGRLERVVDQVFMLTRDFGGYVLSSSIGTRDSDEPPIPLAEDELMSPDYKNGSIAVAENGEPYAWVTVRIPADRFDEALLRFKKLGTVREVSTSAEDVTMQMVDLKARLSHYRAVLRRLLTFLDKAKTVGAALAVQNRIDETELRVEELTAQLKALNETVSYSTLSISLAEKSPQPGVIDESDSFWGSIVHSARLIADGAKYSIVALGAALPFIALAAVVVAVIVIVARSVRRRRDADRPPSPAPPTESEGA